MADIRKADGEFLATNPLGEILFVSKLTCMSTTRDRWCVVLPRAAVRLLDKGRVHQVTLRPVGTLQLY